MLNSKSNFLECICSKFKRYPYYIIAHIFFFTYAYVQMSLYEYKVDLSFTWNQNLSLILNMELIAVE